MVLARWQATIVDDLGNVQNAASVEVRQETGGAPLAVIYSDRDGAAPIANPITTGSDGFAAFHVAGGAYKITATKGAFSREWRYIGIGTAAENDDIAFVRITDGVVSLPSAAQIAWDSGDVTLTHSAAALAFAGATSGYSFSDGPVIANGGLIATGALEIAANDLTENTGVDVQSLVYVHATTAEADDEEFMAVFDLISEHGEGATGNDGNKVSVYAGISSRNGSGPVWALNTVTNMLLGSAPTFAHGYECDISNLTGTHNGDDDGVTGLADTPFSVGINISGGGESRNTAAMLVSGPGTNTVFNRGIAFANDCLRSATIQDLANAEISLDIRGSHTTGLDLSQATISGNAIQLASGHKLSWSSGDVVITHAANALTFTGADSDYVFQTDEDAGTTKLRVHNASDGAVTTKLAAFATYGCDSIGTVKETGRIEANPVEGDTVNSNLRVYTRASDTIAEVARLDKPSTATQTSLMLWDVDNATLERVTVGAASSGGSGFKVLRIPN